jgi:predicted  nucleic acid-binding Zn-ribbon protein
MQINKTVEWATWRWANVKIDKESLSLLKETINIPKEDMENYHRAMFTHAMEFFQKRASLKKPIPKHFFTSYYRICR